MINTDNRLLKATRISPINVYRIFSKPVHNSSSCPQKRSWSCKSTSQGLISDHVRFSRTDERRLPREPYEWRVHVRIPDRPPTIRNAGHVDREATTGNTCFPTADGDFHKFSGADKRPRAAWLHTWEYSSCSTWALWKCCGFLRVRKWSCDVPESRSWKMPKQMCFVIYLSSNIIAFVLIF